MTPPLANQDKNAIALDPNFSTTRLVTREKPVIANDPSSKVQSILFLPPNPERKGEGGLRTKGYFKRSYDEASGLSDNLLLPLVTIITVVFNGEKYLEQTIQSVINQTYDNVESIVIDGGSTDGTIDIIRKYEEQIDYWVSEPDEGIYDAMNKGIQLSTGKIIGLINSDDWYIQNSISTVVNKYLDCDKNERVVISGAMFRTNANREIKFKVSRNQKSLERIKKRMPVNHPATFVSSNTYATIGMFDKNYIISGDYDFIYKAFFSEEVNFILIDECLACMRICQGLSERGLKSIWIKAIEGYQLKKLNTFFLKNMMIFMYILLIDTSKFLLKPLLGNFFLSMYYRYRHKT
jgi:glycosyltransferase involved in cell wall biosynthesis